MKAALLPIVMLAHENDPGTSLRATPIPAAKRDEVLQVMTAGRTVNLSALRAASPISRTAGRAHARTARGTQARPQRPLSLEKHEEVQALLRAGRITAYSAA
jgi:hypothetical protein